MRTCLFKTEKRRGWEDNSVCRVFALQASGSEIETQNSCEKPRMVACSYNPSLGEVETAGALLVFTGQSVYLNLQIQVNVRDPVSKTPRWRLTEEAIEVNLWPAHASTHRAHLPIYNMCTHTHSHMRAHTNSHTHNTQTHKEKQTRNKNKAYQKGKPSSIPRE